MKKTLYILIIVFLTSGKSFASSFDFSNIIEINSTEKMHKPYSNTTSQINNKLMTNTLFYHNDLCKILSNDCLKTTSIMYSESKECIHHPKLSNSLKAMEPLSITTTYDPSSAISKALNYKKSERLYATHLYPLTSNWKKLQTINIEEYFSESINLSYSKGFGVRIRI
jgi:hypothetical protein